MTKGGNKSKKRKKSDNNSDQSTGQVSDSSIHACSSMLGAAGETLYGKPDLSSDAHDDQPLQGNIASTPLPSAPILVPTVNSLGIQNKLDHIIARLHKLDTIDAVSAKLDKLEQRIVNFEDKLATVENKTTELENSVKFLSDQYDTQQTSFQEVKELGDTLIQSHQKVMKEVENVVTNLVKEKEQLRETVTDLQWRSMKTNLIFTGLEGESAQENTESKLRDFLYFELGISDNIPFGNVHRFGRFERGKHRPIVARFLFHQDLQNVKDSAYKLRGSKFGIREQFPAAIEDKRKDLYPLMQRLRSDGENPKLIRDRLLVRGRLQKHEDIIALLEKYQMTARSNAYAEETAVKDVQPPPNEVHMRSPGRRANRSPGSNMRANERIQPLQSAHSSFAHAVTHGPHSVNEHPVRTNGHAGSPTGRVRDFHRPQLGNEQPLRDVRHSGSPTGRDNNIRRGPPIPPATQQTVNNRHDNMPRLAPR